MAKIIFQTYRLAADAAEVELSALVGFGQRALTRLSIRDQSIGTVWQDTFGPVGLGPAADLRNRQLLATITVFDVNPATNDIFVEVSLTGGANPLLIPITDKVQTDWDSLNIVLIIDFV
ncbi:hypothetical protein [Hymenobacter cellulosivorans]|uniref:DUF4279 domain-containing protein n=1 Tax=Hymenobacter cellulosivorans TaxID=2932249 RepID=A0ABY4FFZ6_9BACT|nr:hypothetical protein [Hymenobacter cellulosivorans]UOQ54942.1 hypothetical protein MUN80_09335 [Hymenobacter cellulosivorans]